jgi:hypothetical protein
MTRLQQAFMVVNTRERVQVNLSAFSPTSLLCCLSVIISFGDLLGPLTTARGRSTLVPDIDLLSGILPRLKQFARLESEYAQVSLLSVDISSSCCFHSQNCCLCVSFSNIPQKWERNSIVENTKSQLIYNAHSKHIWILTILKLELILVR